jgi:hypothetical protein
MTNPHQPIRYHKAMVVAAALIALPMFARTAMARDHGDGNRHQARNQRQHERSRVEPAQHERPRYKRQHERPRHGFGLRINWGNRDRNYGRGHRRSHGRDRSRSRSHSPAYLVTRCCSGGYYTTRWVIPVYDTRYDGCGNSFRILIRVGGYQRQFVPARCSTGRHRH